MLQRALLLWCCLGLVPAWAEGLRALAGPARIQIGAAVDVPLLDTDPSYTRVLAREFNAVTPENAMKFSVIHPARGRYDFSQADALVAFAARHGMQVQGHVLLWHQQLPAWVMEGRFSRDELREILREHIQTLVGRYKGKVAVWDVAAEVLDEQGRPRDTFWSQGLGPDYVQQAFRWAHEADPQARLRYNEYGAEGAGAKSDALYHYAAALRQQGTPIHGIGLQMHIDLNDAPDPAAVRYNLMRLGALGLETDITEMDVMLALPASRADLSAQAKHYGAMLRACLDVPTCRSFSTWGISDRHSWIPEFFPGKGAALLFDAQYRPKPAYRAVQRTLRAGRNHVPRH